MLFAWVAYAFRMRFICKIVAQDRRYATICSKVLRSRVVALLWEQIRDMTMAQRIFASVPDELGARLEKRAAEEGRSVSNLVSYLLERAMETWEPVKKDK